VAAAAAGRRTAARAASGAKPRPAAPRRPVGGFVPAVDDEDLAQERDSIAARQRGRRARGERQLEDTRPASRPRPAGAARRPPTRVSNRVVVPGTGVTVDDGAGVLLGAFLWALTLAYINPAGAHRGGVDGVRDWLRAKFLNKDASGAEIRR